MKPCSEMDETNFFRLSVFESRRLRFKRYLVVFERTAYPLSQWSSTPCSGNHLKVKAETLQRTQQIPESVNIYAE